MQLKSFKFRRKKIYNKYRVSDFIEKFETTKTYDFKEDILKKVVVLHIQYLEGKPINREFVEKVGKLFDDSYNTKNWSVAEAVGRLLISVSFIKGLNALIKVDHELMQRRQWNVLRKSVSAILNKMTLGLFPWLIINLVDGPFLSKIVAPGRDYLYKRKLVTWENEKKMRITKKS
jgi:hypothetical protein